MLRRVWCNAVAGHEDQIFHRSPREVHDTYIGLRWGFLNKLAHLMKAELKRPCCGAMQGQTSRSSFPKTSA